MGSGVDWVYAVGGWVLVGFAAVFGAWCLGWDRARGRKRCPKCWYDMGGTPGLRCPECGRECRDERRLGRTRRRWRLSLLALVGLLAGYGVRSVPHYRDDGWVGVIPSSALIFLAPAGATPAAIGTGAYPGLAPRPTVVVNAAGVVTLTAPTPATLSFSEKMEAAAWSRLQAGRLARWQSQVYLERYLRNTGRNPAHGLTLPGRWPVGEAIPGMLKDITPLSTQVRDQRGLWTGGWRVTLAGAKASADEVRVELALRAGRIVYSSTAMHPITITGTRDTFLDRREDPAANDIMRAALAPHLARRDGHVQVIFQDRSESPLWSRISFATYFSFEVRIGDQIVGRGRGAAEWRRPVWKDWEEVAVDWAPGQRERLENERAVIVVRGLYEPAAAEYFAWPFDKPGPAAWVGEFTQPLEFKPYPGERAGP